MSRTRTEHLRSTILGNRQGAVGCPMRRRVGLEFPEDADPVETIEGIAAALGFASAEAVRLKLGAKLPPDVLVAMPASSRPVLRVASAKGVPVLIEALILGLSTAQLYDPSRPVLWTRASLTRRLELFDLGGFYAID